jgi:glucose/arabinose dehydrogenase
VTLQPLIDTGRSRLRPWWIGPTILGWVLLLPLVLIGPAVRQGPLFHLRLITNALEKPVAVVGDPRDAGRLLVLEKAGRVMLVESGVVRPEPLLDLTEEVESGGLEQGLLGVALSPAFPEDGRLYLYLTDRMSRMVLLEYRAALPRLVVDPASRREILAIPDPEPFHNGGQLAFGPDGYLYVGIGDGGLLEGGWRDGRDPASLLGKILRIDVNPAESSELAYAIPPDNPYLGTPGARPEVWAVGFRNPWRFAFDDPSGDVWIADVGQHTWEEVDQLPWREAAGANFGWSGMEGKACYQAETCDRSGVVLPVAVYAHRDGNCAGVGGVVYRGPGTRLAGQYLVGDYCSGRIWTIGPSLHEMVIQIDTGLLITSFGTGSDGATYVTGEGGELMEIVPNP